jgi:hypothetical protein
MGITKRMMEEQEEQRRIATEIAIEAGVLVSCEYHEEVYDAFSGDETPAYKLGNYKLSNGKLGGVFSSPREMTDAIKAAIEDAGMECYSCAKMRSE